jgi:hypothetical protein
MAHSTLKLSGRLTILLYGPDGVLKDRRDAENLVVGAGRGHIASRMTGTSSDVMTHMQLGTGSTTPTAADTALESAVSPRNALTSTTAGGTYSEQLTYLAEFTAGEATGSLREAGIFNASSGGTMLCRTVFPVINKGAGDTLQVTWTISLSAS